MQASMFSPLWHRYAPLKPKLKSHVKVLTQQYRHQQWYILTGGNGVQVRLNAASYAVIGRCDGRFSIQQVWQAVLETQTEDAPTQDEVIQLLNDLDQHDLLIYDVLPNINNLFKRKKQKQVEKFRSFVNPFAFRIPLWDPSRFLNTLNGLAHYTLSSFTLIIWLAAMMLGLALLVTHWPDLLSHAQSHMTTKRYILIGFIAYPFLKAIHELSHALAIKKWGGDVKETGITLFMLAPSPYVDASDALNFKPKYQRIIVSLIGIMTELLIAVIALVVYINAQPGLTQDIAFMVAFICGISSLLFNGNPLLRFDAYYAMCDFLALPNLASRSRAYWSNVLSRFVIGGDDHILPLQLAKGEKKWLALYSPLSLLYILAIFSSFVLWAGSKSLLLGFILGAVIVVSLLLKPLLRMISTILKQAKATNTQIHAKLTLLAIAGLTAACIFFVPAPNTTMAQGVVWLPDHARLRTEVDGVLQQVLVENNALVSKGQLIMLLSNPDLLQEQENLSSQIEKLKVDQFDAMFNNPDQAKNITEQLNKMKLAVARNQEKIDHLNIYSQLNGRLVMPHQDDLLGSHIKQGHELAYVLNQDKIHLRVALPAEKIDLVRNSLIDIDVKLSEFIGQTFDANVLMMTPSSTNTLPSKALGELGGGDLMTNPADEEGMQTVKPIVWVDLDLPEAHFQRVGGRAHVKFSHVSAPIAVQLYRSLKQVFLSQFNPST